MRDIVSLLEESGKTIVLSESITGGGIASRITDISGASKVLWGSFVTYSNDAKIKVLNVKSETIEMYGAVSSEVALEMAIGAISVAQSDYSLSITGYAGPAVDANDKEVGTVFIGIVTKDGLSLTKELHLDGTRVDIRESAIVQALDSIRDLVLRNLNS